MAGILKVDQVQSDSNLSFQVAGANVAYMNSTGLQMTGGTLSLAGTTIIPAVGQIKFPATQNASADANTLDDYEEGTWTPYLYSDGTNGTSYTTQNGYYVKIGRYVTTWFAVQCTLVSGTYLRLYGLPYSVGTTGTGYQSLSYFNGTGRIPIFLETYLGTGGQAWMTSTGYPNPSTLSTYQLGGVYQYLADA